MKRPRFISPHIGGYLFGIAYQNADKTIPHENPIRLNAKGAVLLYGAEIQEVRDINNTIVDLPLDDGYCYFVDKYGKPLANGKVYTYFYQSTVPKESFDNDGQLNSNPIILDNDGKAQINMDGNYRLRIYDKDGVCMGDDDGVGGVLPKPPIKQYCYLCSLIYPNFTKNQIALVSDNYPKRIKKHIALLSGLYAYIDKEKLQVGANSLDVQIIDKPFEFLTVGFRALSVDSKTHVIRHTQPIDDVLSIGLMVLDVDNRLMVKRYHDPPSDKLTIGLNVLSVDDKTYVIRHRQPIDDKLTVGLKVLNVD